MLDDLTDMPFALNWIGEIKPVGGTVQAICLGGEMMITLGPYGFHIDKELSMWKP